MAVSTGYTIADIAALRNVRSLDRVDGYSRLVLRDAGGKPSWYTWIADSSRTPDNDSCITTDDNPLLGRFIKTNQYIEVLNSDRTYYISGSGSDTNDGLTSTSAFATIQKFVDVVCELDLNGFYVYGNVESGTYSSFSLKPLINGYAQLLGEDSDSTIISAAAPGFYFAIDAANCNSGQWYVAGFSIANLFGDGINLFQCRDIWFSDIKFLDCLGSMILAYSSFVEIVQVSLAGSAREFINTSGRSTIQCQGWESYLLQNNPNFSNCFISAKQNSYVRLSPFGFEGQATGIRYKLESGSTLDLSGTDELAIPGSLDGTVDNSTLLGIGSGGHSLTVRDQGIVLTTGATSINFTSAGVSLWNSDGDVTVSIPGGQGGEGDMTKAVYDTTNNGVVDNAEALGGQPGSYYRSRANHTGAQTASTIFDLTEAVDDRVASLLVAGAGINLAYNDTANTLTINSTTESGSNFDINSVLTDITGQILLDDNGNLLNN